MARRIDRHNWIEQWGDLLDNSPTAPIFTDLVTGRERSTKEQLVFLCLAYNQEDNDCGVRALAVSCAAPYEQAHWALQEAGRIAGQPCCIPQIIDAATRLNCFMVQTTCKAKTLLTVERELAGTHGGFLITTLDHAVGVWNGELIDHARGRLWRLDGIYRVEPMRDTLHEVWNQLKPSETATQYMTRRKP